MVAVIFLLMASSASQASLGSEECGLISPKVELALSESRSSLTRGGRDFNRIIGGQNVPIEGLPWQVLHAPLSVKISEEKTKPQVFVRYRMNGLKKACGGAIVSINFVLTAAH